MAEDGKCSIDIDIADTDIYDEVKGYVIKEVANAVMTQCVLRNKSGGRVHGLGM